MIKIKFLNIFEIIRKIVFSACHSNPFYIPPSKIEKLQSGQWVQGFQFQIFKFNYLEDSDIF